MRERGVVRFNAEGPDGLKNHWGGGARTKLTEEHRAALVNIQAGDNAFSNHDQLV